MNINITTFINPFSFFCMPEASQKINLPENDQILSSPNVGSSIDPSKVNHGQYVAVLWQSRWTRGIITMESQCLIWLIDFGIYLRPNEKTVFISLPPEYKKLPTKVFEASIHGVMPLDKRINESCEIENQICTNWNKGAIEKMQEIIKYSKRLYFVPVAVISTKENDVVLGNLYFEASGCSSLVNIVDELEGWPVFLEKNESAYIQNLSVLYSNRRRHRACLLKPLPNVTIPNISTNLSLEEYNSICGKVLDICEARKSDCASEDGSTVVNAKLKEQKTIYTLTFEEIEMYSNMYITIAGQEYNALNLLLNKIRDLRMCEKYKNAKPIGRATTRLGSTHN
ncbi:uncharacterized protein LOC101744759 [Bombyx mori]|uniref:Tudor domain-containing protein n=1 Tax=Bombyx mori TaxID=7091 RepID=A0A8R1WIN8_BOMMO|nr:uncharacterized protein LOC101744759 [Bombyx mori]